MTSALALAAPSIAAFRTDWLRSAVVCGSALALILAGQALPGI